MTKFELNSNRIQVKFDSIRFDRSPSYFVLLLVLLRQRLSKAATAQSPKGKQLAVNRANWTDRLDLGGLRRPQPYSVTGFLTNRIAVYNKFRIQIYIHSD